MTNPFVPGNPEGAGSVPSAPARPVVKSQSEIALLKQSVDASKQKSQQLLAKANVFYATRTPEYQALQAKLPPGETMDSMGKKMSINALVAMEREADAEAQWRKAEIDNIESTHPNFPPGTDSEIKHFLELKKSGAGSKDDPINDWVEKQRRPGEDDTILFNRLSEDVTQKLSDREKNEATLRGLEKIKNGEIKIGSVEYNHIYGDWFRAGLTREDAENAIRQALATQDAENALRKMYREHLAWTNSYPAKKDALLLARKTLRGDLDRQGIAVVQQQIQQIEQQQQQAPSDPIDQIRKITAEPYSSQTSAKNVANVIIAAEAQSLFPDQIKQLLAAHEQFEAVSRNYGADVWEIGEQYEKYMQALQRLRQKNQNTTSTPDVVIPRASPRQRLDRFSSPQPDVSQIPQAPEMLAKKFKMDVRTIPSDAHPNYNEDKPFSNEEKGFLV